MATKKTAQSLKDRIELVDGEPKFEKRIVMSKLVPDSKMYRNAALALQETDGVNVLAYVFGKIHHYEDGQTQYGPYIRYEGEISAIARTGDVSSEVWESAEGYEGMNMILPGGYQNLFTAPIDAVYAENDYNPATAGKGQRRPIVNLPFGVSIGVKYHEAQGFEWVVDRINQGTSDGAKRIAQNATLLLESQ